MQHDWPGTAFVGWRNNLCVSRRPRLSRKEMS